MQARDEGKKSPKVRLGEEGLLLIIEISYVGPISDVRVAIVRRHGTEFKPANGLVIGPKWQEKQGK